MLSMLWSPSWITVAFILLSTDQWNISSYNLATALSAPAIPSRKSFAPAESALSTRWRRSDTATAATAATVAAATTSGSDAVGCFPNAVAVTDHDRSVLQRQTGQVAPSVAALGVPSTCQCQHGYPQVFLMNPLGGSGDGKQRMNSGLLKLSCPHLVNSIDALEDDGYIGNLTSLVQKSPRMEESVQASHQVHATARQAILQSTASSLSSSQPSTSLVEDPMELLKQKLGDMGAKAFLNAGIAGATVEKPDVKCLHAWLGDHLFTGIPSGNDNCDDTKTGARLGDVITSILQHERDVSLGGTPDCHKLCNPQASSLVAEPPKPRNKQRLKTRKEKDRRKRNKQRNQPTTTSN